MGDDSDNRITAWMSGSLRDKIDERVNYGPPEYESRSQWIREGLQYRMALEDALDRRGIELPEDPDERMAMLEDIAHAGVATFATDETDG